MTIELIKSRHYADSESGFYAVYKPYRSLPIILQYVVSFELVATAFEEHPVHMQTEMGNNVISWRNLLS